MASGQTGSANRCDKARWSAGWSCLLLERRAVDEDDVIAANSVSRFTHQGNVFNALVERNFLGNGSTPLVRRSFLDAVGGYDMRFYEAQAQGAEDWQFYLSLAAICEFVVVRRCLVGYRRSPTNLSSTLAGCNGP